MKKVLLFSMLLFACHIGWGQSIPNGDFESWNSRTYNSPDSGWFTSNPKSLAMDDSLTVWKVAGMIGQAIHIQTAIVGSDTLTAYITNTAGDPRNGVGGVPYTQAPTALTGFYRCNVMTGDTAGIIVLFKKSGSLIGAPAKMAFTGSTSTFTPFSIPITLGLTPDTVIIAATSSNLLNNNIGLKSGSWLELDQLLFTGTGITQGIVNGSFDAWISPLPSFDMLIGWQAQINGQGTGVSKTTDKYSGSYALQLLTTVGGVSGTNSVGQITSGQMTKNNGPRGGLPYTKTTDTLSGYYKYSTSGADTGAIFVSLSKSGAFVGGNSFHCMPASTYTYFQIPFSASSTPDTIRVDISSSSTINAIMGSTLKVDKVQLASQRLSVNNVNNSNGIISTYPNPVTDVLHINTGNYFEGNIALNLFDVNGKLVMQNNYDAAKSNISVPVGQLAKGVYFYEIKNNGVIIRDKFVKE